MGAIIHSNPHQPSPTGGGSSTAAIGGLNRVINFESAAVLMSQLLPTILSRLASFLSLSTIVKLDSAASSSSASHFTPADDIQSSIILVISEPSSYGSSPPTTITTGSYLKAAIAKLCGSSKGLPSLRPQVSTTPAFTLREVYQTVKSSTGGSKSIEPMEIDGDDDDDAMTTTTTNKKNSNGASNNTSLMCHPQLVSALAFLIPLLKLQATTSDVQPLAYQLLTLSCC
jgi:hypothetical protein